MHRTIAKAGSILCAFHLCVSVNCSLADDLQDEDYGERCISLKLIDRTEILDGQTILVYMRGGDIYRNRLRNRCPGLRDKRPIMYSTTASQLCNLDRITVLYDRGAGLSPGASCSLGRFLPVSEEDVEAFKAEPRGPEPKPVPGAKPEQIEQDTQDSQN